MYQHQYTALGHSRLSITTNIWLYDIPANMYQHQYTALGHSRLSISAPGYSRLCISTNIRL